MVPRNIFISILSAIPFTFQPSGHTVVTGVVPYSPLPRGACLRFYRAGGFSLPTTCILVDFSSNVTLT